MVHEIKSKKLLERVRGIVSTPFFIPILFLFFLVITIPVITWVTSRPVDIRQRAASAGLTARIIIEPDSGTITPNQTFTADIVVDGGGQPFNAAQATIAVSNLTIVSVNIPSTNIGGCNLTFANQSTTPSISNLSFAGAILNGSSQKCTVATVTLRAGANGIGSINLSNSEVKSSDDNAEIFLSSQNGSFVISSTPTNPIPQSVLAFAPTTASIQNGQNLSVQVRINTNGQTVNGIESDITYPTGIFDVISIDDNNSDFNVPAQEVIGNGTLNIAYGSITPKSGDLLVTTITFRAKATGLADVNFVNPSVVSDISNTDVLKNFNNAQYTVSGEVSIAPTIQPTVTPTTVPPTSVPPTATPTQQLSPTPTPIPNSPVTIAISTQQGATYKATLTLSGSKSTNTTVIFVNNSSNGASYTSSTTWQFPVTLVLGNNTFAVFGEDSNGIKSSILTTNIRRNRLGDINGDDLIDLTDLSLFGSDWSKTTNLTNVLSDMNDDNEVNLTDFSIFAKAYGN